MKHIKLTGNTLGTLLLDEAYELYQYLFSEAYELSKYLFSEAYELSQYLFSEAVAFRRAAPAHEDVALAKLERLDLAGAMLLQRLTALLA